MPRSESHRPRNYAASGVTLRLHRDKTMDFTVALITAGLSAYAFELND